MATEVGIGRTTALVLKAIHKRRDGSETRKNAKYSMIDCRPSEGSKAVSYWSAGATAYVRSIYFGSQD